MQGRHLQLQQEPLRDLLGSQRGRDLALTASRPPTDGPRTDTPIVRYPDHTFYTRRHGRRYGLGTYSHAPVPLTPTATLASAEQPFRDNDFGDAFAAATAMVPAFRNATRGHRLNGVFALTPDELPLVGPAAGAPGLWIAEASWVTHAAGVGRQLANMLLGTGDLLVAPDRLSPNRFAHWSDEQIRATALTNYQGIYDAH
ncbi:FAD-dependent oxidoreductase [Nocardia sp. NPDC057440]|uniref:FAD-dependent oxidoreductase n=1 Tax=Nocardia sp. NPDC057440 TaxID=3346134 RepID=UPI0036725B06